MKRTLRWSRRAERDLEQIERHSPQMARRIQIAAVRFAEQELGDVTKLTGSDSYRLRVGNWRVIFSLQEAGLVVLALRVLNRRDAYR